MVINVRILCLNFVNLCTIYWFIGLLVISRALYYIKKLTALSAVMLYLEDYLESESRTRSL